MKFRSTAQPPGAPRTELCIGDEVTRQPLRASVIGNGKMAVDCCRHLLERDAWTLSLVIANSKRDVAPLKLANLCAANQIKYIDAISPNERAVTDQLAECALDYVFNINSFEILRADILGIPGIRFINFHNGPLPRYRGLNVCSWAILNGERQYGVTWHFIEAEIDAGPIIEQRMFEISHAETAISLIAKCIRTGVDLFFELIRDIEMNNVRTVSQVGTQSSYFSRRTIPFWGCLPFFENALTLDRLSRAINFFPAENTFFLPKFVFEEKVYFAECFSVDGAPGILPAPGTVVDVDDERVCVATSQAMISITTVRDRTSKLVKPEAHFSVGSKLHCQSESSSKSLC